ncbi:MAG TPA: phosphorelay protein [Nitrosopumilaceae archaeon]|nr:phosphorelay protein [Nitrosopumilaceae archaeon]
MSDNFLRIARKEVQEELDALDQILTRCGNDMDISNNAQSIGKHLHKIKGLAPMMDQNDIGDIAKMTDTILKHVIINGVLTGSYQTLVESNLVMKKIFSGTIDKNAGELKSKLRRTYSDVLGY